MKVGTRSGTKLALHETSAADQQITRPEHLFEELGR